MDLALPDDNEADLIVDRAANLGVAALVLSTSVESRNLQKGADEIPDKLAGPTKVVGAMWPLRCGRG